MTQFVKIFAEETMSQLEFSINNYLKNNPVKVISISYTSDNKYVYSERAIVVFEKEQKNVNKLDIAKKIIKENYKDADCGIFDSRNIVGDPMTTIYRGNELTVDICYYYSYFEVFGLSEEEFNELEKFYNTLDEEENELC